MNLLEMVASDLATWNAHAPAGATHVAVIGGNLVFYKTHLDNELAMVHQDGAWRAMTSRNIPLYAREKPKKERSPVIPAKIYNIATSFAEWSKYAPEGATHVALGSNGDPVWFKKAAENMFGQWNHESCHWALVASYELPGELFEKPMTVKPRIGMPVVYIGPSSRNGWRGQIDKIEDLRIRVRWDKATQWYSIEAFTGAPRYYDEHGMPYVSRLVAPDATRDLTNYGSEVEVEAESEDKTRGRYIVKGVFGGPTKEHDKLDDAVRDAQQRARDSKSGQPYRVYEALSEYQREEPKVKHTQLSY